MNRYCPNCKENYEIPNIKSMKDLENVVCPVCGQPIPKNSKKPAPAGGYTENELRWGLFFQTIYRLAYLFYLTVSIVGIEGFLLHFDKLLYSMTILALVVYIAQYIVNTAFLHGIPRFRHGIWMLPLGAIAGAFIFKSVRGACLGICVVFAVRHFVRDLMFTLIGKIIDLATRK